MSERHQFGLLKIIIFVLLVLNNIFVMLAQDEDSTPETPPVATATETPTKAFTEMPLPTERPSVIPSPTETPTEMPLLTKPPSATPPSAETPTAEPSVTETQPVAEAPAPTDPEADDDPAETETTTLTQTPVTNEAEATEIPPSTPISIPTLPEQAPMQLLAYESLDNGDLSPWALGTGWSLTASETGLALQVTNSSESLRYTKGPFFNADAEARFLLTTGSIRFSIRQSSVGSYTVILDANGAVQLMRVGTPIAITVAPANTAGWRNLRLSVVYDIIRVTVDGVEIIAVRDDAPLPPGEISVAASFPLGEDGVTRSGQMQMDDFSLWVPHHEYAAYPSPTTIPSTSIAPTPMPTTEIPKLTPTPSPAIELPIPTLTPAPTIVAENMPPTEIVTEEVIEATVEVGEPPLPQTDGESEGKLNTKAVSPSAEQMLSALASGNNNFASAVTIQTVYPANIDNGDTTAATLEAGEPLPLGCGYNVGRTVWFNFTPSSDGNYNISLAGSSFDTVLAVYTGTEVNNLTQIGCNDDASRTGLSSALTLRGLTAGTTYHIQIGGFQQAFGLYNILIQRIGAPAASRPILLQPVAGTTTVDQTPLFTWGAAANATAYEIQISAARNFSMLVIDPAPVIFALNFSPVSNLEPGQYYWRVRGLNDNSTPGAFSAARTLTIRTTPPNQTTPAENTSVITARPTFSYTAYGIGATYDIQLSDTNDFVADLDQTLSCTPTRCAPTTFSLHQGEWRWRLQARDSQGNLTTFTNSRRFTVNLLRSPQPDAVITSAATANVSFRWHGVTGAAGYTLQIDDNPGFSSPTSYSPTPMTSTTYDVTGIAAGNYFWRVLVTGLDNDPALVPVRTFTVSTRAPTAPVLISPNNRATTAAQTPSLDWADYNGAGGPTFTYNIDICTVSRCSPASTIVESAVGLTTSEYQISTVLAPRTYFWRVQVVNSFGVRGAFALRSLIVRSAPPQLVSPAHESSSANPTPRLSWRAFPSATYAIEIATDEAFSNIVVTQTGITTLFFVPPVPLTEDTYHWRVRAVDATSNSGVTAYSMPRKFTIGPRPPTAPALLSPNHNSTLADQTPLFDWNDVADAATYCILIDDNANFSSPVINECALTTSEFTPASPLNPARYYWKVRSVNALGGAGNYSRARSVRVHTSGPSLINPADGATTTAVRPRLTWTAYPGSTLYNIRIDDSAACDSSIGSFSSTTNNFTPPPLEQGTYYWCVQARDYLNNADSLTDFGVVRSFTVNILTSPAQNANTTSNRPAFRWASAAAGARYCLDVDDDSDFDTDGPILYSVCDLTVLSHTPPAPLAYGIYYWRVRVSTDGGATYTPTAPPFRLLTLSPAAPSTPALSLPGNGAITWTTEPVLTWRTSGTGSPVAYEVLVDDASNFGSPEFTATIAAGNCSATACSIAVNPALTIDTTYYWRVRSVNSYGVYSRFSSTFRFKIKTPVVPVLIAPVYDSTTITQPIFRWTRPAGAVTFDIRLDTSNPPVNILGAGLRANSFRPNAPLISTTYYWQVQAYDRLGTPSGWSEVRSLKIITATNSAPALNRFGPGSTDAPHTVQLSWGPVSWTSPGGWYELVVDDNANFSSPLYQTPRDTSVLPGGVQIILEGSQGFPTLTNGTYYWRVRACDSAGRCGSWSNRGTFVVDR